MAERVQKQDGGDDLAILHPECEAVIGDRTITMREYGFVEGLRLTPLVQPMAEALVNLALRDGYMDTSKAAMIFAENDMAIVTLIARACDQPEDWIECLGDEQGQQLLGLWWQVNIGFFVRRVGALLAQQTMDATLAKARAGQISTPPSSTMDTTPPASADSPSVS